jgi:hypothetical protein
MFAVVHEGWKLVHHTQRPGSAAASNDATPDAVAPSAAAATDSRAVASPTKGDFELFNTRTDPLNLVNLAPQHPDIVARLARMITDWRAGCEAARLNSDDEAQESLSHDELERLRSLGYIN